MVAIPDTIQLVGSKSCYHLLPLNWIDWPSPSTIKLISHVSHVSWPFEFPSHERMLFHFLFYLFLSLVRQINKQNDNKTYPMTYSIKLKKTLENNITTIFPPQKIQIFLTPSHTCCREFSFLESLNHAKKSWYMRGRKGYIYTVKPFKTATT